MTIDSGDHNEEFFYRTRAASTVLNTVAQEIWLWANAVMPNRTPADAIKKLALEEVPELWRALRESGKLDGDELADIGIIWLDLCRMAGVDPLEIIILKMVINENRTWTSRYGVFQHETDD